MVLTGVIVWSLLALSVSIGNLAPRIESIRDVIAGLTLLDSFNYRDFFMATIGNIGGVLWIPVILAVPYGAGSFVLSLFRVNSKGEAKYAALKLALGFGVLSAINQGIGLTGLLFPLVMGTVNALMAICGIAFVVKGKPWKAFRISADESRFPYYGMAIVVIAAYVLMRLPDAHEDSMALPS